MTRRSGQRQPIRLFVFSGNVGNEKAPSFSAADWLRIDLEVGGASNLLDYNNNDDDDDDDHHHHNNNSNNSNNNNNRKKSSDWFGTAYFVSQEPIRVRVSWPPKRIDKKASR